MNRKKLLTMICLTVVMIVSTVMVGCAGEETTPTTPTAPEEVKPIVLIRHMVWPATHLREVNVELPWWEELEKRTDGRIEIETHAAATLAPVPESYNVVLTGLADISQCPMGTITGRFPLDYMFGLAKFDVATNRSCLIVDQMYKEFPEFKAQFHDTKFLYVYTPPYEQLATVKPITVLEDCEGRAISASGYTVDRAKALGMVPTSVVLSDLYEALSKGVIEGTFNGWEISVSRKLVEYQKYFLDYNFTFNNFFVVMSPTVWASLTPDLQKIIDDWATDPKRIEFYDQGNWKNFQDARNTAIEQYGCVENTLPPQELQRWLKADEQAQEKLIADLENKGYPNARDMYKMYFELLDQYAITR